MPSVPLAAHVNQTPFPSQYFQTVNQHAEVFHVVVLRATYDMTRRDTDGTMYFADAQAPLVTEDVWMGEPNASSPVWESDLAPYKPKCDVIVVNATAYSPGARPMRKWVAGVRVNSWTKYLTVTGPRSFASFGRVTQPDPAISVPLNYSLAFGGERKTALSASEIANGVQPAVWDTDERNPVGLGFGHSDRAKQATASNEKPSKWTIRDKPLNLAAPQLEQDGSAFTGQANYLPVSLGCIGRAWRPRRELAGIYDEAWKAQQWPLPPEDFDYGYWNCAPQDQQIDFPPPRTSIMLTNIYPGLEQWEGFLPRHELYAWVRVKDVMIIPKRLNLDTLIVDMAKQQVSAVYRVLVSGEGRVSGIDTRIRAIYRPS